MISMTTIRAYCIAASLLSAGASQAASFTYTLPQFTGNGVSGATQTIGTINLSSLPEGQSVLSATISGFFGTPLSPNSSAAEIYADGIKVATCVYQSYCMTNLFDDPQTWSYTFTGAELDIFKDGQVVLTALQTNWGNVLLGTTTLSGIAGPTPAVPEPETYALLFSGAAALAYISRRRSA